MSSPAQPRWALLLHGMVGSLHRSTYRADTEVASARLLVLCSLSQLAHIVEANSERGVDVFVHSWNPQSGTFMDRLYGKHLRGSKHDHTVTSTRARSQAMSIGRAALLMQHHERERGLAYSLALVMRLDAFVGAPFRLTGMDPQHIHLSSFCAWRPPRYKHEEARVSQSAIRCQREGAQPVVLGPPLSSRFWGMHRELEEETDRAFFTPDMWFAASPSVVATWHDIAKHWTARVRGLLRRNLTQFWAHQVWPAHIHDVLNMSSAVQFHTKAIMLGREAYSTLVMRECNRGAAGRASERWPECLVRSGSACLAGSFPCGSQGAGSLVVCADVRIKRAAMHRRADGVVVASHPHDGTLSRPAAKELEASLAGWVEHQCPFQKLLPVACARGMARGNGALAADGLRHGLFQVECSASELATLSRARGWAVKAMSVTDDSARSSLVQGVPLTSQRAIHNVSVPGYCRPVIRGAGDCNGDKQGSWGVTEVTVESVAQACADLCASCARCRFVSYSHRFKECSWFHDCKLDRLRHDVVGFFSRKIMTKGHEDTFHLLPDERTDRTNKFDTRET